MPAIIPVNVINDDDNGHHIEGTSGNDEINGNGGSDTLVGLQGNDVLDGGEGGDALLGDSYPENSDPAGNDILVGGGGDDTLYGGGGVDHFDGGSEFDRVYFNFRAATQGASANLATQTISNDGFGNAETMISIEGLGPGTAFADTFIGSDQFDFFEGSFGDTLRGNGGDDHFEVSGAPALIDGGDNVDMLSFFSMLTALVPDTNGDGLAEIVFAAHGVNVDLGSNRIVDDGFGRSGEVYNVESLVGSSFADRLVGSAGNNFMQGLGGGDVMSGGAGSDSLEGGDGNDTLDGGADFDSAHFTFEAGPGALTLVADADGLSVMRDGERVAGISVNGTTVRVQGVNSGARLGGDDLTNVEQLNFWIAGSSSPLRINVVDAAATTGFLAGSGDADIILAGAGNDNIDGGGGTDFIIGGAGTDILAGGGGDDRLEGGEGGDALLGDSYPDNSGPAGNDILMGGGGDDTLYGGGGVDHFDGGSGFDRVYFNFRAATQGVWASLATGQVVNDGFGNAETMISIEGLGPGTAFADTFIGSNQFDFFEGSFGDTLRGNGGNDAFEISGAPALIDGGDNIDMLSFSSMHFGALIPDSNDDGLAERVFASHGVNVDLGINRIVDDGFGRSGEVYNVESLVGSSFADRLVGSAGNNFMQGLGGGDVMSGGAGSDSLEGGDGNDTLDGGADFDSAHFTFEAGPGALTLVADADGLSVMRDGERVAGISVNGTTVRVQGVNSGARLGGDDLTNVEQLNFWIAGSPAALNVRVTTGTAAVNFLNGTAGHDVILGLGDNDTILGLAGNDLIDGGAGNDLLLGDGTSAYLGPAGNDVLRGGGGDDFLSGGGGVDMVDGGAGFDRVGFFQRNATHGAVVDLLTQTVANDGYGNAETLVSIEGIGPGTVHADRFTGDHGPNILQGDFADVLIGNGGDDVFQVSGAPALTDGGGGIDTIGFFGEISGSQAPDNDGNGLTEIVFATAGINVDLSINALNNDGFGRSGSIVNVENVSGGSLADTIYGSDLDNVLSGNAGDDVLRGYGSNDTLQGGIGNDALDGGKGADRLVGGGGDDVLTGGADSDLFEFGPNSGHDRIVDFRSKDVIVILGVAGVDDFSDLAIVAVGKDALVSWGTADSILVEDYKASKLSAADFAFSEPAMTAMMAMDGSLGGGASQLLPWETFAAAA